MVGAKLWTHRTRTEHQHQLQSSLPNISSHPPLHGFACSKHSQARRICRRWLCQWSCIQAAASDATPPSTGLVARLFVHAITSLTLHFPLALMPALPALPYCSLLPHHCIKLVVIDEIYLLPCYYVNICNLLRGGIMKSYYFSTTGLLLLSHGVMKTPLFHNQNSRT